MLTVIRRSQLQGLIAMDSATISHLGEIAEVWLDETGQVAYLSGSAGYLPLEQVAAISNTALSTYGRLVVDAPESLQSLTQLAVQTPTGEPLGWVEDFLFDWHTGEITAYILAGQIAEPLGERAVLYPDDVEDLTVEYLIIREGAQDRLQPESTGLTGFLSEKSQQVQHLVKVMSDALSETLQGGSHALSSPQEQRDVVRVKVKEVSHALDAEGDHDRHALREATDYLHDQWESLHESLNRSGQRARSAVDSAWKHLTGKS